MTPTREASPRESASGAHRSEDFRLPLQNAGTVARRYAVLSVVWVLLAFLADRLGIAPLPTGSGVVLVTGMTLSSSLFLLLGRLPPAEQPALASLVAVEALIAIGWATVYWGFTGGGQHGAAAMLAGALYVAALLLALPLASRRHFGWLCAASIAGTLGNLLLRPALTGELPASPELVGAAGLVAVLVATLVTGGHVSARRDWQQQRYEDLRQSLDRVASRADRDQLTGSYTRRFVIELLGREKARSDRTGQTFCVLLLEIDQHEADRYAPAAVDRVIASFAQRVRSELRDMDSLDRHVPLQPTLGRRSTLGRMSGEEFIVVLPYTSIKGALRAAERIRRAVVRHLRDGADPVTVSIGIAEYRPAETVSDLLARADDALYSARRGGTNRVHCAGADGRSSAIVMPEITRAS